MLHLDGQSTNISYLEISLNQHFRLPYQCHSFSVVCAREMFKPSKDSSSLPLCTWKKFFGWRLRIFCEWCRKWSSFRAILAHFTWPRAQLLDGSIGTTIAWGLPPYAAYPGAAWGLPCQFPYGVRSGEFLLHEVWGPVSFLNVSCEVYRHAHRKVSKWST